jgi:hypothetical protein
VGIPQLAGGNFWQPLVREHFVLSERWSGTKQAITAKTKHHINKKRISFYFSLITSQLFLRGGEGNQKKH